MTVESIGVPFDGYGRQGHQSRAAQVLRENGLSRVLHEHGTDSGDLDLPAFETSRGAQTGLLNEPALLEMTWQLSTVSAKSWVRGGFRWWSVGTVPFCSA